MLRNSSLHRNKKNVKLILFPTTKVIKIARCKILISVNQHGK